MAKTFLQLANEVKAMDSQANVDDAQVLLAVKNAINEAYDYLYCENPWWWNVSEASITPDSDGLLVLPEETAFVLGIQGSNGSPMNPRSRQQQVEYENEIVGCGIQTYSQEGYDATTGFPVLNTLPALTSATTVRYCPQPAELAADGDLIVGPRQVYHFMKWKAHAIRLLTNEERINLRQESELKANEYLKKLTGANRMFLQAHKNFISVAR